MMQWSPVLSFEGCTICGTAMCDLPRACQQGLATARIAYASATVRAHQPTLPVHVQSPWQKNWVCHGVACKRHQMHHVCSAAVDLMARTIGSSAVAAIMG
jgi:hypothetical protein